MSLSAPLAGAGQLSPLAPTPNWSALEAYQQTITRQEFARLVNQVYSIDGAFWNYAGIDDKRVIVFSDTGEVAPALHAPFCRQRQRLRARCPIITRRRRLRTIRPGRSRASSIALDPGHIGGDWAKLEARYFKLGDDPPVEEAKLNLITCERAGRTPPGRRRDRSSGPSTTTSRSPLCAPTICIAKPSPRWRCQSTPAHSGYTPSFLFGLPMPHAPHASSAAAIENEIDNEAALLFYRVAEIRARGDVVNKQHPDLTICVHYNADDWGDPGSSHPDRP